MTQQGKKETRPETTLVTKQRLQIFKRQKKRKKGHNKKRGKRIPFLLLFPILGMLISRKEKAGPKN